jgi:hypothetical protein
MAPLSTDGSSDSPRAALKKESLDESCRSVSFFHEGEVFYIPAIDDYTETERQMMWFKSYEYDQIKANNKILVKMMMTGRYAEDHQYCYRGLEFKTVEGHRQRRNAKTIASLAIFSEQERQYDDGERDTEEIREVYQEISSQCHARAHKMALKDATSADVSSVAVPPHPTDTSQEMQVEFGFSSWQEDADSTLTKDTEMDLWSAGSDEAKSIGSADAVGPSQPTFLDGLIRKTQRPQRAAIA